jgi:CBS domain containing-hemolysin-like protein
MKDFYTGSGMTDKAIRDIMTTPVFVQKSEKVNDLLKLLQKHKSHIAVVIDEFGGTLGIVTMEDILEELVGEIWDEHDEVFEEIVQLDENSYKIDGTVNIDEVFELFEMYEDDVYDSNTLSGWIIEINEKFPNVGDIINFKNLEIEILEADDRKIDWAAVKKVIREENEESDD